MWGYRRIHGELTKLDCADRALLAALLGVIPKARRQGQRLLITPDTILRWHRDIVRRRWGARSRRGRNGRPATRQSIRALVRRLARENPGELVAQDQDLRSLPRLVTPGQLKPRGDSRDQEKHEPQAHDG